MNKEKAQIPHSLRIALYEPDIPQNAGSALRLCAGLSVGLDIIEPCGFLMDDKKLRRAAMDYISLADRQIFSSWEKFKEARKNNRIILMTTKTDNTYTNFQFKPGDVLLAGSESSGVPEDVHNFCDHRITIDMHPDARSLNVINATAMIVGEALRQIRG